MSFISSTRTLGGLYRYGAAEYIYDPEDRAVGIFHVVDEIRRGLPGGDGVREIAVVDTPFLPGAGWPAPDWWGLSPAGAACVRSSPPGRFDPNFPNGVYLSTAGLPGDPCDALAALIDLVSRQSVPGWRSLVEVTVYATIDPAALSRVAATTGAAVVAVGKVRHRGALVCRSKMTGGCDLDLAEVVTITRGGVEVAAVEHERGEAVSIMVGREYWRRPTLSEGDPGYGYGSLRAQYANRWVRS